MIVYKGLLLVTWSDNCLLRLVGCLGFIDYQPL